MKPIDIIGLKNFRVFDTKEGFLEELSSINILTGANNSGKSSLVKVLQLLKNSVKESKYPFDLDLNKQEHLLGDFDNILNDKNNRKVEVTLPFLFMGMKNIFINLGFEAPNFHNTYKAKLRSINVGDKRGKELLFSFYYRDATQLEKDIDKANFDKELEAFNHKTNGTDSADKTDIFKFNNFLFAPYENPLSGYIVWHVNLKKLKVFLNDLLKFYEIYKERKREWNADSFEWVDNVAKDMDIIPSGVVRAFKGEVNSDKWRDFLNTTIGDQNGISGQEKIGDRDHDSEDFYSPPYEIENLLYFKVFDLLENNLNWRESDGEGQEYSVIKHCFESSWENLIQRLLTVNFVSNIKGENSRSYNARSNSSFVSLLKTFDTDDFLDTSFVKKYLKDFQIGKKISLRNNPKYESILVSITDLDGNERELVDFGYGIKQLIIILIQISVLAKKNKSYEHGYDYDGEFVRDQYELSLLIVEEPESNLHPKWQSLLADMFVQANKEFNIQFVIETHSEYLIRRFQTLIAEKQLEVKNVNIFYLRNPQTAEKSKKQVERIQIEDDGSINFEAFDSGFFDQNYNLHMSLLNIRREHFFKEFEDLKNAHQASENKVQEGEAIIKKHQAKIQETKEKIGENLNKINDLQQKIDEYVSKADVTKYRVIILNRFSNHFKLQSLTKDYLVAGQYLLENVETNGDYSPVILQYGRAIENELHQIFLRLNPVGKWMFGKMQGSLEKLMNGTTTFDTCNAAQFTQLPIELTNMFNNYPNLRYNLIDNLRGIRNDASHAGQKLTRQQAIDYIIMANDFLDRWINELK